MWHGTRLEQNSRHTHHRASPSASPMTGSSGVSSTPRPLGSITDFSGILDRPPSRTMTARETLRSSPMTGFRFTFQIASSFADTTPRSRRGLRASFAEFPVPLISEGAGNAGCPMHPQPRVQMKKAHERSHHRFTGFVPAFPAQWFYGLLRALPGDHACLTPSPALLIADLTPALGRQNDTTWPYANRPRSSRALPRPPHPAPRS
jgi:hypothetical protein